MPPRASKPWDNVPVYAGPTSNGHLDIEFARESAGASDNDLHLFRRLTGGDRPDELDPITFSRFQRLSSFLYYQNPFARRCADISTEMVLGPGLSIDIDKTKMADPSAEGVKELVNRFLTHPANEFDIRLPGYFTSLNAVQGELFLPVFVDPINGDLGVGYLEHYLVQDVVWNPVNRMQAIAVIQRPVKTGGKPIWWNVVRAKQGDDVPMFPPHPMLEDAANGGQEIIRSADVPDQRITAANPSDYEYGGEILYFAANKLGTGRGRSAFEPTLDWMHAYDNFLFGDLRNAGLQAAFVWDVTIEEADEPTLKKRANEMKANPPRPGETIFHNQKETWKANSPNLNAASHTELGVQVKKIIGLALGLPPHLVGAENDTNRSSSSDSSIPFIRRMEQRQRLLVYVVQTIIDYQLDQKFHANILKTPRPYPYRIVLPSLTAGEILAQAEALYNITNAVVEAMNNGVTNSSEAQRVWYAYGLMEKDVPKDLADLIKSDRDAGIIPDPVQQAKDELKAASIGPKLPGSNAKPGTDKRVKRAKTGQGGPGGAARGK